MNEFNSGNQEKVYQPIEHKKEYREQLEERYRNQETTAFVAIFLLTIFLLISSISQFAILDYALAILFDLDDSDQVFNIPIKMLISLLVTAFLPVASVIDQSEILPKRLKFLGIHLIWFLFFADIYLTFTAMLKVSSSDSNEILRPVTSLVIAAVLSTSALFVSRAIITLFRKWKKARMDQKIVTIYGVDPKPLYKDVEQIKLSEEKEAARQEAKEAKEELKEEKAKYKEQFTSQETKYTKKIQGLEDKLIHYKEYSDSILEFKKNFNPVKKMIVDFTSQNKSIFDKLSGLDESVKELNFPPPPKIDISSDSSNEVIEKPTFYWADYDKSEENLRLPSELSPVGYILFEAIQKEHLPKPIVTEYAPKEGLPKCLVLDFDDYSVVVYCRDEEFKGGEQKWNTEDEINFKSRLSNQQSMEGIQGLVFTAEEIMNNPSKISAQIKDVIDSKVIESYED
ncbi:MAG: hypothetical protein MGU50_02325 [Trichodesmium sp. MAG_R02]|jgi:hypothetical protein|nr:hypothetical protein [Trichodesmium sp. MAG_R02]